MLLFVVVIVYKAIDLETTLHTYLKIDCYFCVSIEPVKFKIRNFNRNDNKKTDFQGFMYM